MIGGAIAPYVPPFWISLVAGITFIIFGIYTLLSKEGMITKIRERSNVVVTSFSLIAIMEFGDKTQLAVIALAAGYDAPLQVFLGVMAAFILLTGLGAVFGATLCRLVSSHYIRIGAGLTFLLFGVLFLFESFTGTKFF